MTNFKVLVSAPPILPQVNEYKSLCAKAGVDLIAGANDIIEYDGTKWEVKFDSSNESGVQYITNTNTGIQYKWTGSSWVKSYEGEYRAGDWSLVI